MRRGPDWHAAYLGLGSNLGDKGRDPGRCGGAAGGHTGHPRHRALVESYRTPPWGDTDQDWFLNAAMGIETSLTPHELLEVGLAIETAMGRVREHRRGPRVIDIDVLSYEGATISDAAPRTATAVSCASAPSCWCSS